MFIHLDDRSKFFSVVLSWVQGVYESSFLLTNSSSNSAGIHMSQVLSSYELELVFFKYLTRRAGDYIRFTRVIVNLLSDIYIFKYFMYT